MRNLYNKKMTDNTKHTDELEPIDVKALMAEYAEMSFTDLIMEVKDMQDKLEAEKKSLAACAFGRKKAEDELELLRGRVSASTKILNGGADICIDCEATKDTDTEKDE